jgi:hypothetical protein
MANRYAAPVETLHLILCGYAWVRFFFHYGASLVQERLGKGILTVYKLVEIG